MRPPLKYHGGKYYLSSWIISKFPSDYVSLNYYEPFLGGASVFLRKLPSISENLSDLDNSLINFYQVLTSTCDGLKDLLKTLAYHQGNFLWFSQAATTSKLDEAINFYVKNRMSRGGLGESFAWSNRLRGGKPGDQNAWETSIENLSEVAKKLRRASISCQSYSSILPVLLPNAFIYLDPPYLPETRTALNTYNIEMDKKDHEDMLALIKASPAKILLSGYENDLYNKELSSWNRFEKTVVNNASQAKKKNTRKEVLWANY